MSDSVAPLAMHVAADGGIGQPGAVSTLGTIGNISLGGTDYLANAFPWSPGPTWANDSDDAHVMLWSTFLLGCAAVGRATYRVYLANDLGDTIAEAFADTGTRAVSLAHFNLAANGSALAAKDLFTGNYEVGIELSTLVSGTFFSNNGYARTTIAVIG